MGQQKTCIHYSDILAANAYVLCSKEVLSYGMDYILEWNTGMAIFFVDTMSYRVSTISGMVGDL